MAASSFGVRVADGDAADCIHVVDPDAEKRAALAEQFGIQTGPDSNAAIAAAQAVVLATKPQILHEVCAAMAAAVQKHQPLIISIAAGIRSTDIARWMGGDTAIVRNMPNTPSLVRSWATGLYSNGQVHEQQRGSASMGTLRHLLEQLLEVQAVGQASQRIVTCRVTQAVFGGLARADVGLRTGHAQGPQLAAFGHTAHGDLAPLRKARVSHHVTGVEIVK